MGAAAGSLPMAEEPSGEEFALPLVEESSQNVSIAAGLSGLFAGYTLPVFGGWTCSLLLMAVLVQAGRGKITPMLEPEMPLHSLGEDIEYFATAQGSLVVRTLNVATEIVNRTAGWSIAAPTAPPTPSPPPPPPPFDPAAQLGVTAPLGFFDPLGFCSVGDEVGFRNLRAAEVKHGRVAMLAAVGALAQHFVRLPGLEGAPSTSPGFAALTAGVMEAAPSPGAYGVAALFLFAGVMELGVWTQDPSKEVGNFGDPLDLGMYDDDMRNRELNNGRVAMFAALSIVAGEMMTGKDGVQQLELMPAALGIVAQKLVASQ